MTRRLHFTSCISWTGQAWRTHDTRQTCMFDPEAFCRQVRLAERGIMDAIFAPDFMTFSGRAALEPITLLASLAPRLSRIGLVASMSTTYNEPYNLARMFASLDQISGGRAGWNMVTTAVDGVSANYGLAEAPEHDTRYARADEFVSVVTRLWDSWRDDAIVLRREREIFAEPDAIQSIHHKGRWFSVDGPLNIPRSPQGQPVRFQAGSSAAGRDFGARWAEVIFTAQPVLELAQDFYKEMHRRARAFGRAGREPLILPGLMPLLGESNEEVETLQAERQQAQGEAISRLSELLQVDLAALPPDDPIPPGLLPEHSTINGMRGRADLYLEMARRYALTPRQLAGQGGHLVYPGTPNQIADMIAEWFDEHGCDGFTLLWPNERANELFVDQVIPKLQQRAIYPVTYAGSTLRDHLGLERPPHPGFSGGSC